MLDGVYLDAANDATIAFRVFIYLTGLFTALIPGMWAAYMGLKALLYYLKLKITPDRAYY